MRITELSHARPCVFHGAVIQARFNNRLCYWPGVWQTGPIGLRLAGQSARGAPLWDRQSEGDTAPPGHRDAARWSRRTPGPKCRMPPHPGLPDLPNQLLAAHPPRWREMAGAGCVLPLGPTQANGTRRLPLLRQRMRPAQPYTASARLMKASTMELAMRSNTGPTTAASAADSKP